MSAHQSFDGVRLVVHAKAVNYRCAGFIQPDDGGADVFLHISAVEQAGMSSVNEGDKLSFELEKDRKSGKMSAGQLQKA